MKRSTHLATTSPSRLLDTFIRRFDPAIRKLVREARAKLHRRLPTAIELVYDNYNALAIGFASSERMSDTIVSLAVYARGVNLYFMYGAALADPHRLLLGSGNQGRFVRLESAATLDRHEIDQLLATAIEEGETPLPQRGRGRVVIKSVSPKRRERRLTVLKPGRKRVP
jgi:hypothetical protein